MCCRRLRWRWSNDRVKALGLPIEPLKRFKPWALALTLLAMEWQSAGFDPNLGLDKHFYDRARAERKAVKGLETVAFQISRFDEMTMPDQDRLLAQTLKELETETASVTALADAWKAGDVPDGREDRAAGHQERPAHVRAAGGRAQSRVAAPDRGAV